jgi:hypothetical protein
MGYYYEDKEAYGSFINSIKKIKGNVRESAKHYKIQVNPAGGVGNKLRSNLHYKMVEFRWRRSRKKKIIQEYFALAKKLRESKRIVEKTPHHYLHVHQILWTFPKACVIWLIRHPIDIYTSSIKREKNDKNYKNHWSTEGFINEFNYSFLLYEFYKKIFNKSIFYLKYEDFVGDSEKQLERVCQYIEEPFDKNALKIEKHEAFEWKPDPYLSSDIVSKTDKKWSDYLSAAEANKIEIALAHLMDKYNFKSCTNHN